MTKNLQKILEEIAAEQARHAAATEALMARLKKSVLASEFTFNGKSRKVSDYKLVTREYYYDCPYNPGIRSNDYIEAEGMYGICEKEFEYGGGTDTCNYRRFAREFEATFGVSMYKILDKVEMKYKEPRR